MDVNIFIIGGAVLLGYFFFSVWRAKSAIAKHCRKEIEQVLHGEEHKVKGRYE
ncbi:hypothetical protein KY329_00535 [Candidatus Woesearchaeota archaeon]|nr:hypothetical protein [Candidatus Woesearchaeota archaeon]